MFGADAWFVWVVIAGMVFMFITAGYLTWFMLNKAKQEREEQGIEPSSGVNTPDNNSEN